MAPYKQKNESYRHPKSIKPNPTPKTEVSKIENKFPIYFLKKFTQEKIKQKLKLNNKTT